MILRLHEGNHRMVMDNCINISNPRTSKLTITFLKLSQYSSSGISGGDESKSMTRWRLPPGSRFILCIYRRASVVCNMVEPLQLFSAGLRTNDAPFDSGQSNEHNTYMFAMSLRTHASCTVTLRLLRYTTAVNHYIQVVNSRFTHLRAHHIHWCAYHIRWCANHCDDRIERRNFELYISNIIITHLNNTLTTDSASFIIRKII